MERLWPVELSFCKLCNKSKLDLKYKIRGLCESCFKTVQNKGNLRNYPRYKEDKTKAFDGRHRFSKRLANLLYCIRNVGVGEIAECLEVSSEDFRAWMQDNVPPEYCKKLILMKKAISDEVYEFNYPEYELETWAMPGEGSYEVSI